MLPVLMTFALGALDGGVAVESMQAPLRGRAGTSVPLVLRLSPALQATGARVRLRGDGTSEPLLRDMRRDEGATFSYDLLLPPSAEEHFQYYAFEGLSGAQVLWSSDERALLVRPNLGAKPLTPVPFAVGVTTAGLCVVSSLVLGLLLAQNSAELSAFSSSGAEVQGSEVFKVAERGRAYATGLVGLGIGWFAVSAVTGLLAFFTDFEP